MHPDINIYRVTVGTDINSYSCYVISDNAQDAYEKAVKFIKDNDYSYDTSFRTVEFVATQKADHIFVKY